MKCGFTSCPEWWVTLRIEVHCNSVNSVVPFSGPVIISIIAIIWLSVWWNPEEGGRMCQSFNILPSQLPKRLVFPMPWNIPKLLKTLQAFDNILRVRPEHQTKWMSSGPCQSCHRSRQLSCINVLMYTWKMASRNHLAFRCWKHRPGTHRDYRGTAETGAICENPLRGLCGTQLKIKTLRDIYQGTFEPCHVGVAIW